MIMVKFRWGMLDTQISFNALFWKFSEKSQKNYNLFILDAILPWQKKLADAEIALSQLIPS